MTAVIEFLSAFTLFLMILTAFLSLAQLEMGSNDTSVDRLDRAAAQGLDRMTSDGGWYVPMLDDGSFDYPNSTSNWHLQPIDELNQGIVLAGLMNDNKLDFERINALSNITEDNLAQGLGLSAKYSLHLEIKITESDVPNRVGLCSLPEELRGELLKHRQHHSKKFNWDRKSSCSFSRFITAAEKPITYR